MKRTGLFVFVAACFALLLSDPVQAATRFVSTGGTDTPDCTNSASPCKTIGFAIGQATAGDTIEIAAGTYSENNLSITINLTIHGAGQSSGATCAAGATCIDGSAADQVIAVGDGVNPFSVTISNLTIQNGHLIDPLGFGCGGGIVNNINSNLTLNNSTIRQNTSDGSGGGICNAGTLTMNDSLVGGPDSVDGNTSTGSGGGIFNGSGATSTLTNTTVMNNNAFIGGGVFNNFGSTLDLNNSTVSNNNADVDGGGLYCDASTEINIDHGIIANNTADKDNNSDGDGGGIFAFGNDGGATLSLVNGTAVSGNQAQNGGGIFTGPQAIATIDNSIISNNQAMVNNLVTAVGGGGIFNSGTMTIQNESTIDNNHADLANGGGIYHQFDDFGVTSLTISQTTISNNTAGANGGGIYRDAAMDLLNVTISRNQANVFTAANGEGGGIYNSGGGGCANGTLLATLTHVTIAENSAFSGGGIIVDDPCFPVDIKNSLVANNTTGGDCVISNGGLLNSLGHNLSSDATCTTFTGTGDLLNQPAGIGPLADNGGSLAIHPLTHALAFNSVAVDGVPPADCTDANSNPLTIDERGFPRPGAGLGPNCDIGAFELQAVAQLTVTPTSLSFTSDVGVTTAAQTITVTSTGNVPATVSGDSLQGADAPLFNISQDNCTGKTLAPTETCTILVTFTPTAAGLFNLASVLITSSDATIVPTDTVTLTGTATGGAAPLFLEGSGFTCELTSLTGPLPGGTWNAFLWSLSPAFGLLLRLKRKK
jgi:hypothetical protein